MFMRVQQSRECRRFVCGITQYKLLRQGGVIITEPSTRSLLSVIKASQLIVSKLFFLLPILH